MNREELLKTALFEVRIKTKDEKIDIDQKDLTYDEARALVTKIISENMTDLKFIKVMENTEKDFGFGGCYSDGYEAYISAGRKWTKGVLKQCCPRRSESGRMSKPEDEEQLPDTWDIRGDDLCCSYCGSLHPDRVIELVKQLGFLIIDDTDKNYKYYLTRDDVPNAGFGGIKFYTMHFNADQKERYNSELRDWKERVKSINDQLEDYRLHK